MPRVNVFDIRRGGFTAERWPVLGGVWLPNRASPWLMDLVCLYRAHVAIQWGSRPCWGFRISRSTSGEPMILKVAAGLYMALLLGVVAFQVAVIVGAPWGHLTQGGRHLGQLPPRRRVVAGVSIALLLCMGAAIASFVGLGPSLPAWVGWAVVAVQALSTLANWATPSAAERRLWAPINTLMLAAALYVVTQA